MTAKIRIKDLALRAVIGLNDWEREKKQDLLVNIELEFESGPGLESDSVEHTVDYKAINKSVIYGIESSEFFLLESLAGHVLKIVMENPRVLAATVEVDKPHSLRFTRSVSVVVSARRE